MRRFEDWPERLAAYLAGHAGSRFGYAPPEVDCCRFAFGAVLATTGVDMHAPFHGQYRSARGALRVMRSYVGSPALISVLPKLAAEHGLAPAAPAFGSRGDLALCRGGDLYALGVVSLDGRSVTGMAATGLNSVPLAQALQIWRV